MPEFVVSVRAIRENCVRFRKQALATPDEIRDRAARCTYWVVDTTNGVFAPSKFAAYQDMSVEKYLGLERKKSGFSGSLARECIERIIGKKFNESTAYATFLEDFLLRLGVAGRCDARFIEVGTSHR